MIVLLFSICCTGLIKPASARALMENRAEGYEDESWTTFAQNLLKFSDTEKEEIQTLDKRHGNLQDCGNDVST